MKLIKITVLRQKSDLVFKFFTVLHYDINVSLRSTSCVYLSNVALAVLHFSSALVHSDTNPSISRPCRELYSYATAAR